jgi:hypothetical protein
MAESLQLLEAVVGAALAREARPSPERIIELITQMRVAAPCSDDEAKQLAREFETRHGVTMTIGSVLKQADYEPWLDGARAEIDPFYWRRYRDLLAKNGFSGDVLATLDDVTNQILGLLEFPKKPGSWDRRGMVVGHVQSGKTANYTGLICKAADAGYRLIVVIAGVHNNLRNQTQLRIDEGFVGRDSARMMSNRDNPIIGVGKFDSSKRPVTFTNSVRDFNKTMATALGVGLDGLKEPAVFVIKKNSSTLKNLLEWLREHSVRAGGTSVDAPMLLIDDEADNASINTKHGKGEVTKINGQIRDLLQMFERSCYIGYTATPFANIFIEPESNHEMLGADLFPKDFIVSLDPPSNYFGASRVFLSDSDQIIRPIEDNEDFLPLKHPTDFHMAAMPPSLTDAVRTFVVACTIRHLRGHNDAHCSMLVNASIKNDVQRQLKNQLHLLLERIQQSVRVNASLPPEQALRDLEVRALHDAWQKEYGEIAGFGWPEVQSRLHEAVSPVKTVLINSKSKDALDYQGNSKSGLSVIAVGGFALSRGLTLEGLMVSYFLRNSMMYDTLMQMGRWFGYRPGYDDLCRIWMPEAAQGWYEHIAEATEELREELRIMQAANATPEQFGLKVRSDPETLIVTARNKMGTGEKLRVSIGLGKSFIETSTLKRDEASRETNRVAATQFAATLASLGHPLSSAEAVSGGWLLSGISPEPILDFIGAFQNHPASIKTDPAPVRRYIEERRETELAKWDVLVTSVRALDENGLRDESLGVVINCQRRMEGGTEADNIRTGKLPVTNKQRVASRGVEKTGLTPEQITAAEQDFFRHHGKENYPDNIYRRVRERPLFILHLLAIGKDGEDLSGQRPTVAWSISFPETRTQEKLVEYVVNTTWWRENYRDEMDDDDAGGDND